MKNTYSGPQQVHNMFNSGTSGNSGYGSTTDESDNGSPLRGPRYLPVYDTPLLGATIDDDDHSEDGDENDSDHEHTNGDSIKNIPIHFKAMALSRKVAWNLPHESNTTSIQSENDSLLSSRNPNCPSRSKTRKHRLMSILIVFAVFVGLVVISNLERKIHDSDGQHFRPTKELTSDLPFPAISRASMDAIGSPNNMFRMDLFVPDMMKTLLPFPTGAFWTNFVLKDATPQNSDNQENTGFESDLSNPVVVYPYAFKWNSNIIAISYPSFRRIVQPLVIQDVFWPDISLSASEGVDSRKILAYDHLSVTLRMNAPMIATQNEAASFFDMYMVQGSPYITGKFTRASPKFDALSVWDKVGCVSGSAHTGGLCTVTKADDQNFFYLSMTGVQFLITQAEGQQWILFVNGGVPITFLVTADRHTIVTARPFTGVIRLAIVPPGAALDGPTVDNLLNHSSIYPISSKVLVDYDDVPKAGSDEASVTFSYETIAGYGNQNAELLMLALPHHGHALKASKATIPKFDASYNCIKGDMIPVVGNEWIAYVEPLTDLSLESKMEISDSYVLESIKKNIEIDKDLIIPTATDIYGFGKEIARMAQLAILADELKMGKTIVQEIVGKAQTYLSSWLDGRSEDQFVFDQDLGGIVSRGSLQNPQADFGNGWYNDHHFHYGYYIYAATIISKFNETFREDYSTHIYTLIHDIANLSPVSLDLLTPSNHDDEPKQRLHELFPCARHKSWFDGHSWASGLFEQANGKSQESSSEAVNAYFAAYLWQNLNGNKKAMNFSRLLLATEIRSAKTYWHTGPTNELYPSVFADNYMVGNMGGLDATCTTWFGNKMSYVHLINFLPLTGITNELFSKDFVEGEYKFLKPFIHETEESWQGYIAALNGIINPTEAWKQAEKLESYKLDVALSKSQVLHWIATRPGLGKTWNATKAGNESQNSFDASCSSNQNCLAAKLIGECCPTTQGVYLGCCNSR